MKALLYILIACLLALLAISGSHTQRPAKTAKRQTVQQAASATPPQIAHAKAVSYQTVFENDYADALLFIRQNHAAFEKLYKTSAEKNMLKAIVFPELVRYSLFRDFFETEALALGYVDYGAEVVDFSIGRFQMKPSFVEKLEEYVKESETLRLKHHSITVYNNTSATGIRKERVKRLTTLHWQVKYLECFYDITTERLGDVHWQNDEEKLKFYATAYNHGFDASKQEIEQWTDAKAFPYGTNYLGKQYSYSDISVHFFINQLKTQE